MLKRISEATSQSNIIKAFPASDFHRSHQSHCNFSLTHFGSYSRPVLGLMGRDAAYFNYSTGAVATALNSHVTWISRGNYESLNVSGALLECGRYRSRTVEWPGLNRFKEEED